MDEERDYVVFTDDDGNEFELDVITYFDYKDEEYAILADCSCDCEECDDECEDDGLYIMKIVPGQDEDTEEFVPPAEEDMDELIALAEKILSEDCCGDDCGCEDGECTCGCHDKE